tara:strand:+ start:298 stop:516 length:219 start_codon:yes stop_codon:yes gene_type:complete
MSITKQILERIENHKGRELDLNNRRDRLYLFSALEREFNKRDAIIQNISNCLKGASTYDESTHKVIVDSRKK